MWNKKLQLDIQDNANQKPEDIRALAELLKTYAEELAHCKNDLFELLKRKKRMPRQAPSIPSEK